MTGALILLLIVAIVATGMALYLSSEYEGMRDHIDFISNERLRLIQGTAQAPLYIYSLPRRSEDRIDIIGYFESAGYHLPVIVARFFFTPGDPADRERAEHAANELLKALGFFVCALVEHIFRRQSFDFWVNKAIFAVKK